MVQEELSGTLSVSDPQTLVTCKPTVGVDLYNNSITGNVAMTMSGAASDSHHVPCVVSKGYSKDSFSSYSETDISAPLKQSGGDIGGGINQPCLIIRN